MHASAQVGGPICHVPFTQVASSPQHASGTGHMIPGATSHGAPLIGESGQDVLPPPPPVPAPPEPLLDVAGAPALPLDVAGAPALPLDVAGAPALPPEPPAVLGVVSLLEHARTKTDAPIARKVRNNIVSPPL
jgi:hypothetical protein